MTTQERTNDIFKNVRNDLGYGNVTARFSTFKEFKITWQNTPDRIDFQISDYMEDASDETIEGLARTVFSMIAGKSTGYKQTLKDYCIDPDFIRTKQPIYLERARDTVKETKGYFRDLNVSYQRLVGKGLIPPMPDVKILWTKENNIKRMGSTSTLMKVITVSKMLDSEIIPESVLDYTLYHEFCHIVIGIDPDYDVRRTMFEELDSKFKGKKTAEAWMKILDMYF